MARLRAKLAAKGWKFDATTGCDFCPLCVRLGNDTDPEFNVPPART